MNHPSSPATRYNHVRKFETSNIGRLFIQKIVDARPEGVTVARWIEMIFGLHERFILQYKSLQAFDLPGYFKPVPDIRIPGYKSKRHVKSGKNLWVRFDLKYPDVIEIEAHIGHGGREPRIFQMDRSQWLTIKCYLKPRKPNDLAFHVQVP